MLVVFSRFILRLFGWRILNEYPKEVRKSIIIAIPHTSNWDFPLGILTKWAIGEDVKYLIKSSVFKFPYGWIFKALGGFPVDRSKSNNFVDQVVQLFNEKEEFIINIAPEGTRKKTEKLKTGFYYIALNAKIPLVLISFDWENKELNFSRPIYVTGDYGKDIQKLKAFYKGIKGKIPEAGWGYEETYR